MTASSAALDSLDARLARLSLLSYVEQVTPGYQVGWVHRLICARLSRFSASLTAGERPRLIISMPPRHGKSTLAERLSVWHLGHHPECEVVSASYALKPARDRVREARRLVSLPATQRAFPGLRLAEDQRAKTEWRTTAGGGMLAVGATGALTGAGADLLIVDDPHKSWAEAYSPTRREAVWEWYQAVAMTRLSPRSGQLLIATRWHEDDLIGRILETQPGAWETLSLPALATTDEEHRQQGDALHPERYPVEVLREIRDTLASRQWLALYQGQPTTPGGSVWRREWWRHWTAAEPTAEQAAAGWRRRPEVFDRVVISCDLTFGSTSASASWAVCTVVGERGGLFYVLDEARGRWGFTESMQAIMQLLARWPAAHVLVEDKANGPAVIDALRRSIGRVLPVSPDGGKVARAHAVSALIERGAVFLPERSHWLADWIDETSSFPEGAHDDRVDALSQALRVMSRHTVIVASQRGAA